MKKIVLIFAIMLTSIMPSIAENVQQTPVQNTKTQPVNNAPKVSYYENGIPIYSNANDANTNGLRKELPAGQSRSNDNFPHYQGVKN